MPKFTVRTKVAAKELFRSLGAAEIFGGRAELSKITDDGPLAISGIRHESVLEITEEGTEGAAATGMKGTDGKCSQPFFTGVELVFFSSSSEDTKQVVVNKPFTFILQVSSLPCLVWSHIISGNPRFLYFIGSSFFRIRRIIFL